MRKLNAEFDAILVEPVEFENNFGAIIVPDIGQEKGIFGKIVSIGPGSNTITGEFIPTTLKVGNLVVLPSMGPVKFIFEGKDYLICNEKQVLATIKEQ